MPNYRQKNRNRNKNKNRNKQGNQQEQQKQQPKEKTSKAQQQQEEVETELLKEQVVSIEENVEVKLFDEQNENLGKKPNNQQTQEHDEKEKQQQQQPATPSTTTTAKLSSETRENIIQNVDEFVKVKEIEQPATTTQEMGGKHSKTDEEYPPPECLLYKELQQQLDDEVILQHIESDKSSIPSTPSSKVKVIIHRIAVEDQAKTSPEAEENFVEVPIQNTDSIISTEKSEKIEIPEKRTTTSSKLTEYATKLETESVELLKNSTSKTESVKIINEKAIEPLSDATTSTYVTKTLGALKKQPDLIKKLPVEASKSTRNKKDAKRHNQRVQESPISEITSTKVTENVENPDRRQVEKTIEAHCRQSLDSTIATKTTQHVKALNKQSDSAETASVKITKSTEVEKNFVPHDRHPDFVSPPPPKVIYHRIRVEGEATIEEMSNQMDSISLPLAETTTTSPPPITATETYHVDSPINDILVRHSSTPTSLLIQELSDTSLSDYNDNTPLVSEVESETEISASTNTGRKQQQKMQLTDMHVTNAKVPILSMPTTPIIANRTAKTDVNTNFDDNDDDDDNDYEDIEIISPTRQENQQSESLRQRRVKKREALDSHFLPQLLSPRYLDCIIEENSDLSDARSDCSNNNNVGDPPTTPQSPESMDIRARRADARFPKSSLDFTRKHKHGQLPKAPTMPGAICEEPQAFIIETKVISKSKAKIAGEDYIIGDERREMQKETRTDCSTLPASEDAEVVYIDSASSSMSDLQELVSSDADGEDNSAVHSREIEDDDDDTTLSGMDLDTDVNELMTCMTIQNSSDSRENTPVNQKICETMTNKQNENSEGELESKTITREKIDSEILTTPREQSNDTQNFFVRRSSPNTAVAVSSTSTVAETVNVDANSLLETLEAEMNNVRDVLNSFDELIATPQQSSPLSSPLSSLLPPPPPVPQRRKNVVNCMSLNSKREHSQSPPPLPPPPACDDDNSFYNTIQQQHQKQNTQQQPNHPPSYTPFPASASNAAFIRQESADSYCSDSSQCTAINLCASPPPTATPTIKTKNLPFDEQFKNISDNLPQQQQFREDDTSVSIKKLRHLCTETVASMPYGENVLRELANVATNICEAQRLQQQEKQQQEKQQEKQHQELSNNNINKMPYPLPNMPKIDQLQLSKPNEKFIISPQIPPSVATNVGYITKTADTTWLAMPTEMDPKLLVCVSPAQRAYIDEQQKNSNIQKPDELLDAHQKYIDRRGYHEYTKEQVLALNNENQQERQILETAAIMKKLRKSLTPPPVPPPPVPVKSCETAAKAKIQKNQNINTKPTTTNTTTTKMIMESILSGKDSRDELSKTTVLPVDANNKNDAINQNANEKATKIREQIITSGDNANNNNKNRLLAIIYDDTTTAAPQLMKSNERNFEDQITTTVTKSTSSSFENNSRQIRNNVDGAFVSDPATSNSNIVNSSQQSSLHSGEQNHTSAKKIPASFPTTTTHQQQQQQFGETSTSNMQNIESNFTRMFPTIRGGNLFEDRANKRYSNIETSTTNNSPFCSQLLSTQPKRYSNIETHSYESKKRTENGQVVFDYTDAKHEAHTDGKPMEHFPIKSDMKNSFLGTNQTVAMREPQQQQYQQSSSSTSTSHVDEIMSALKLNTKQDLFSATAGPVPSSSTTAAPATAPPILSTDGNSLFTKIYKTEDEKEHEAHFKNSEKSTATVASTAASTTESSTNRSLSSLPPASQSAATSATSYEEFRQRAKAAAEAIFSPDTQDQRQPSTFHQHSGIDHEKLFKDFDKLSNQLRTELDAGKTQRAEREKSASLYDLSRTQQHFNEHFKELKRQRHEHMQELERGIERSMFSRQQKRQSAERQPHLRSYDIPIRVENGHVPTGKVFEVPIRLEQGQQQQQQSSYQVTGPTQQQQYTSHDTYYDNEQARQFRRAESMFNLPTEQHNKLLSQQHQPQKTPQTQPPRERSYSNQFEGRRSDAADDWSRYASDLGFSENITRPFAREVEICYQRQRAPRIIRAPRLTVSTNDLYNKNGSGNAQSSYDTFNAYNVRRTQAPLANASLPSHKQQKQYLSCYSVLERDPNPTYISTTSRRGVSPAPTLPQHSSQTEQLQHYRVSEQEMRQRRASLPREIQEQQLKYIQSKEEELKTEFERLQQERRRLMDELQQTHPQPPASPPLLTPPPPRHAYRPAPPRRLPTLSEDEVFRQQMAEEWLNKVAEREDRRLHKIIKISKAHENENARIIPIEFSSNAACGKPDIGSEFLQRVQERRTKLDMAADSDWESGAESQPQPTAGQTSENEDLPPVKVYEGRSEADLRHLPKHLREFAKFSNHQTEKIDGGQREIHQEEEHSQEATDNASTSASKKTSIMKTVKISRQHPYAGHQQPSSINSTSTLMHNLSGDHVDADPAARTAQYSTSNTVTPSTVEATSTLIPSSQPQPQLPPKPPQEQVPSTTKSMATPTTANLSPFLLDKLPTLTPTSFPQFSSFDDHFANSPFKSKIFEEFDSFWRRFHNSTPTTTDSTAFHQNI